MNNVLRTLVFDGQTSLTIADTTKLVQKAIERHKLSPASALVLGKALSAMTFASVGLKSDEGEVSLSVQSDGEGGNIQISGNRALFLRGFIENTRASGDIADPQTECDVFGGNGSLTIIRDDGYSRPFVGSCAFPEKGGLDAAFEEYYRVSEQLSTRLATTVELDGNGDCVFAGVAAVQLLPFADEATVQKTNEMPLISLLNDVREKGVEEGVRMRYSPDFGVWEAREAQYRCNCSRAKLEEVLVSLGEAQMRQIIKEDGAVRVHCHYCNSDYEFTKEDADRLFEKR